MAKKEEFLIWCEYKVEADSHRDTCAAKLRSEGLSSKFGVYTRKSRGGWAVYVAPH